ncbi:lysylphosphatidylglycerol synthase domain-containing protein [Brachybacterium sp. J144]|uniref:lysylphosphatidylglycerol synthase domain-containing protein n=1 Tax=Brachybacterium sp. J144 TaxID=3116487 RepID=UPI002E77030C|nr:lysylphosphatidylglycerol synthase domain-containing protein [Brachybacterium sp. J144]MEE1651688.1 lysylphosphatidylglycerol synthase domain-containing protein [Brachybacterium sp. J144]
MSAADDPAPETPAPFLAELAEEFETPTPPRVSPARAVAAALSVLLVLAMLAWALPWATGATWPLILEALTTMPAWALPAMLVLGAAALVLEAVTVRTAVAGSRLGTVLPAHAAATGLGLALPGGTVLGLGLLGWLLRRAGVAVGAIVTGILAASLVDLVVSSILVPLLGLGAYALSATALPLPGGIWAAVLAVAGSVLALALTGLGLRRSVLAAVLERLAQLGDAIPTAGVLAQRDALVDLLRRRPLSLALPTLAARIMQWTALLLALRAAGVEVPLLLTIALFALGRVLALVPITPGGAGITETVGAAALVGLGVVAADAAAAMLLLAVATLVVPLVGGGIAVAAAMARSSGSAQPSSSRSS